MTSVGSIDTATDAPVQEDLELAWQFAPGHWGNGYATEAARAVAGWAFEDSAHELFAVMRPANQRAEKLADGWVCSGSARPTSTTTSAPGVRLRPTDLVTANNG